MRVIHVGVRNEDQSALLQYARSQGWTARSELYTWDTLDLRSSLAWQINDPRHHILTPSPDLNDFAMRLEVERMASALLRIRHTLRLCLTPTDSTLLHISDEDEWTKIYTTITVQG